MACALSPADATTDSVTEQAFVAFLDGIADMPQAQAVQAVDSVMQAAQARPGNFIIWLIGPTPIFMSRRRIGPTSDCMSRLPEQ